MNIRQAGCSKCKNRTTAKIKVYIQESGIKSWNPRMAYQPADERTRRPIWQFAKRGREGTKQFESEDEEKRGLT